MKSVKTYQSVNSDRETSSFSISRMQDIFKKRAGKIDEPHRHNYFTVLVIQSGTGIHKIDFNTYKIGSNQIYFVAPGQVHQVIEYDESIGFVMTFSNQFLVENSIPISFIDSLNLFQSYGQSPPLQPSASSFQTILNFAENIAELFSSEVQMRNLSIGSFLKLLLIECNNICSTNPIESEIDSSRILLRNFKHLVDANYAMQHATSFYAAKLNITPDHLNRTVKSKIGLTAKEYIQARIITEAKRLIFFTALSTKEIGYELGFNEPANFSAFFKKNTQLSPRNFKKFEIIS